MKLLILTAEAITAEQLRAALPAGADPQAGEVMIVAPALQPNPIKFWLSDADEAIDRARQVEERSVQELNAEGVPASGDTGESDPLQAIEDALQTFAADRIIVFSHGDGGAYREQVDPAEVQERFGVPATVAEL